MVLANFVSANGSGLRSNGPENKTHDVGQPTHTLTHEETTVTLKTSHPSRIAT